jgi:hypothetical protein
MNILVRSSRKLLLAAYAAGTLDIYLGLGVEDDGGDSSVTTLLTVSQAQKNIFISWELGRGVL